MVFSEEYYLVFALSNFCYLVMEQFVLFIAGSVFWFLKNLLNQYKCPDSYVSLHNKMQLAN